MSSLSQGGYEHHTCPICNSKRLTEDRDTGDIICADCGSVIAERTERPGPEWRELGEESLERERVGPPLSLRRPDMGLATTIERRRGSEKLRFWEKRTFYTPKQRSLRRGLRIIETLSSKLSITRLARDQAASVYRRAIKTGFLRGHSVRSVAAVCVYYACRESGIPVTLDAISELGGIERKIFARDYRSLIESLGTKMPIVQSERYVGRIASTFSVDEKTVRAAYNILRQAKRNSLVAGLDPRSLAGGALYLASLSSEKHLLQREVARVAGVSSYTLRKRVQLLRRYAKEQKATKLLQLA